MQKRTSGGIPIALKDTRRKAHLALRVTTTRLALTCLDVFRSGRDSGLVALGPLVMEWNPGDLGGHVFTLGARSSLTRAERKALGQGMRDAGLAASLSGEAQFVAYVSECSAVAA